MPKIVKDEDIYQAAIEAVLGHGYAGATTKQIADMAGISEVTLFRKYGSKAELVKQAIAAMITEIDFESASYHTGDITADLLRVVAAYQETAERYRGFYYTVLSEIPRHSELADLVGTPLGMISSLSKLILKYQQEGVLIEEPPLSAVAALLGPLIVTNMIANAGMDVSLTEADLERHVQRFLDGRRL